MEVNCAVRLLYKSLGVKGLINPKTFLSAKRHNRHLNIFIRASIRLFFFLVFSYISLRIALQQYTIYILKSVLNRFAFLSGFLLNFQNLCYINNGSHCLSIWKCLLQNVCCKMSFAKARIYLYLLLFILWCTFHLRFHVFLSFRFLLHPLRVIYTTSPLYTDFPALPATHHCMF